MVAVAVGDVELVGLGIDLGVGRVPELRRAVVGAVGVVAARARRSPASPTLQQEGAVVRELQHVRVLAVGRRPREAAVAVAVAGDVDVVVVVDVDAVLAGRPDAAVRLAAPAGPMKPSSAGPPQACSRLPSGSNCMTAGAGRQQSAIGPNGPRVARERRSARPLRWSSDRAGPDRRRRRSRRPRRRSACAPAGGSRCCRAGRPRCRRPGRSASCWAAASASSGRPRTRGALP